MEIIHCSQCSRKGSWDTLKKTCWQGKHVKSKKIRMPECLRRPLAWSDNGTRFYATVQEWHHLQSGNPWINGVVITKEWLIARRNGSEPEVKPVPKPKPVKQIPKPVINTPVTVHRCQEDPVSRCVYIGMREFSCGFKVAA